MSVELDPEAVRSFVTFRHRNLPPRRDVPPRADPLAIGRLAGQLAGRVLGSICDGDQCKVAECSGLMVYAMDGYGLNYEEVCQLACHKVAEVLRQITPDHRQTDPKRHMALKSCIGQAEPLVLVVKLAEILAIIERIPKEYDQQTMAARALDLRNWVDRTGHILEAMKALKGLPRVQSALRKARAGLAGVARLANEAKAHGRAQRDEAAGQASRGGPGEGPRREAVGGPRPLDRRAAVSA